MKLHVKGFTIVELVVAATILVILISIWFYSYTQNISDARDSTRNIDLSALGSQLSLYKQQRWAFPFPSDRFNIMNATQIVAIQWKINNNVALTTADSIPLDPEMDIPYVYSVSHNRQEYQISASIENGDYPYSIVVWNYKSVSKNILPTIVTAADQNADLDVSIWNPGRDLFIYNNGVHTLPYDFISGKPYTDGSSFTTLLNDAGKDFFQNTDYRSCEEIYAAAKSITPAWNTDEYQILNTSWVLINLNCSCTMSWCSSV